MEKIIFRTSEILATRGSTEFSIRGIVLKNTSYT